MRITTVSATIYYWIFRQLGCGRKQGIFGGYGLINDSVVPDMKLSPNVGSDRSWVWNAAADVSEGEPEPQTLAIRFANSESTCRLSFSS